MCRFEIDFVMISDDQTLNNLHPLAGGEKEGSKFMRNTFSISYETRVPVSSNKQTLENVMRIGESTASAPNQT